MTIEITKNTEQALAPRWLLLNIFIAMGFAGFTLLGWVFDIDVLPRIVEGMIPMAPSTAILFVWYGSALYLKTSRSLSGRLLWFIFVTSILFILISFLLLTSSAQGIYLNLEYFGMDITGDVQGAPVGHMSPATALCFILLGLSFLKILRGKSPVWLAFSGPFISGVLVVLSSVFLIGYIIDSPFLYGGEYVPPAFSTILCFLMLGFSLYYFNIIQLKTLYSSENTHRYHLLETLVLVAFGIGVLAIFSLYEFYFQEKKADLISVAKSRASIMESVARFGSKQRTDLPVDNVEATLSQLRDAHGILGGFGSTGEFILGRLAGDQIVLLLRHRHSTETNTETSIPLNSSFAEPMRRALKGESGTLIGIDYRGRKVLAAYESVAVLNLGLVVKVDLDEVRAPFISTGFIVSSGGLFIIIIGAFAFLQLSEPLIRSIKELQGRYEMAVRGSKDGLWDRPDVNRDEEWWSDDWYALVGLENNEIKASSSNFKKLLHPDDLPRMEDALKNHFDGQEEYDVEYRLKHKSGEYKWFRSRGAVQRDKDGKAMRMSGSILDIHDEKKNSETIEKLSQVAQQIPVSVVITDHEGNIEFGNQALMELSGYSEEEILGQNPKIFKSGESPDTYYKAMWETIAQGKEWRGVFHNKKKNGELYWESVLIFPLKDINGKVSNFIGLKEDITEKKQLESTLIDHERLIRSVINNLNDGLIIANMAGNIQLFNHGAEKIFGYKAEEVMEKPVSILMDDTYKEKHEVGFARFQKTHKILPINTSMEVVARSKDDTAIPIELTLTQMEQRGELLAVGTIRDISERQEAEEKARDYQKRNEMILNSAAEGIYGLDLNGFTTFANPAAEKMLGYSFKEMMNCIQHELIHHSKHDGSPYEKSECPIYSAFKDGGIHHVDSEVFWKKNGDCFPVEYTSIPIVENGVITGAVVTFRDITEKKESEKRIDLAQRQLVAAQKLAGVGELAAGVSHEVLNPVNIISVHTQMLQRKTADDANIQNFCNKVRHEIDRIQKIMGSLLAFSRSGNAEFQRGALRGTIESVMTLVEEEYKLDNIKIVRDWCDSLIDISYDPDKIRQVFLNLFHNAKHAMPDGGTITISCRPASNKGYHQFTFSDTGTGMSEEIRLKIFEPFFTTKVEGEGTGMGMSVIHGIIQEHGGKIRVESEEGKGTTFTISLPVAK